MGKTVSEKILARCAGKASVRAGDIVTAKVDTAMMDDILGPRIISDSLKRFGNQIKDPSRVVVISDHYTPAATINQADIVAFTRKWAKDHGVSQYYEGIGPCHQILAEYGMSLPGTLLVGTDSHTCTSGAFGCFGTGIGSTEMLGVLITGEIWLCVPETVRFIWNNRLQPGVMAKDLILKVIGDIGHAGATYLAMEFDGEAIRSLPMDERMCISNMCVEAGAKTGLLPVDETVNDYLAEHGCKKAYIPVTSDDDAEIKEEYVYDASALEPQVSCPHNVDDVHPITEVAGIPIDQCYLGSCTGGRLNDLKTAASILKGHRIADSCRLLVSPASKRIWKEADRLGYLSVLADAGATILAPTCGACLGVHSGLVGSGESCASTSNRNFKGRMGSPDSLVYLVSPATLAATAIEGRLADPRQYGTGGQ